jgi:guanosine-3',5'-bis(diphosphate) 3'-pyrophosphohydrolase
MTKPLDANARLLLEAASFAARAHRGQLRKDHETPYASHPFRVCLIVRTLFGYDDPHMLMAALLHDTIEDTNTDYDELAEKFGPEVAQWAATLSKDKRLPDEQREEAYLQALCAAPWQVQVCKLADVLDNLLDSAKLESDRQGHFLQKAEKAYARLKQSATAETQGPLALVAQALQQAR